MKPKHMRQAVSLLRNGPVTRANMHAAAELAISAAIATEAVLVEKTQHIEYLRTRLNKIQAIAADGLLDLGCDCRDCVVCHGTLRPRLSLLRPRRAPNPQGRGYLTSNRLWRPTKNARGMMETLQRSGHYLEGAALALAVRGTTDRLSVGLSYQTTKAAGACPCCGQPSIRRVLNDSGRLRLRQLQRRGIAR